MTTNDGIGLNGSAIESERDRIEQKQKADEEKAKTKAREEAAAKEAEEDAKKKADKKRKRKKQESPKPAITPNTTKKTRETSRILNLLDEIVGEFSPGIAQPLRLKVARMIADKTASEESKEGVLPILRVELNMTRKREEAIGKVISACNPLAKNQRDMATALEG
jgi:hypothetical protein